jgi:hypothetical protein
MRKILAAVLISNLLLPWAFAAGQNTGQTPPASSTALQAQANSGVLQAQTNSDPAQQGAQTTRPQARARERSYQRETRGTSQGISKKEKLFMVAIAGTSMAIGAIAGGGEGLAIGAIVGGWGAYLGHRVWKWVK